MAIPEELMIDIFSRLPAKSVGRFRCLSKLWREILSTPEFIKSHLNLQTNPQQNLLLVAALNTIHTISDVKNGTVSRKIQLIDEWEEAIGSCDGLVLLLNEKSEKILIVVVSYYDTDEYYPDNFDTFVDVYCVKKGVWKRVDNSPYDLSSARRCTGACVSGAVHWLAPSKKQGDYRSVIAAFDLAREVFDEIPVPNDVSMDSGCYQLVVLGGCLCITDAGRSLHQDNNKTDIWIMHEYGMAESWTKFTIDCGGEVLLVYNLKEKSLKNMVVDGASAYVLDGCVFVESLLSPCFGAP
ncbi:hypothetical protein MIMGU_mgv1a010975mg [Erythranthe guttata]|uniref:F-box domain-containing protein n=1 Tax=Erythranthe guttata TaxID=4155 RepID=A0A022RZM1_ERYGU|nr:hypothetical protein MIMGU_mgv1a010975mg [Erythranthe guttata]